MFKSRRRYFKICLFFPFIIYIYFGPAVFTEFWLRISEDHGAIPSLEKAQTTQMANPTEMTEVQTSHSLQAPVTKPFSEAVSDKYIQVGYFDLKGNIMGCITDENCNEFRVRNLQQAMLLCETYGDSCQGFVFDEKSGQLHLKNNITGETSHESVLLFYVKKTFRQNLKILVQKQCAIAVDTFHDFSNSGCVLPVLDPFNKHIMKYMDNNTAQIRCPGKHYTVYKNGVLSIIEQGKPVMKNIKVEAITRKSHSDWGVIFTDKVFEYPREKSSKIDEEFLRVSIETVEGKKVVEFHGEVVRKPAVVQRKIDKGGLDVNVLMVGFDSTSSAHMQRALPEVYKFLKDELHSHIFQGYSVVGDGTTPQLTAMLTGHTEAELPEARRGFANSSTIDSWPWIFKEYRRYGYATMYSEDDAFLNTFNYRLYGFKDPPTDHYSRTFWQTTGAGQCIKARPQPEVHFSYIESFMRAYKDVPKLGFAFLATISHSNMNTLKHAQEYVLGFFKSMKEEDFLNDTILMVFSDHGMRYGDVRVTMQSKLEERLPFLSITLPERVRKKFPELDHILAENSEKVTSPFDIHATLRHILNYSTVRAKSEKTGMSLFRRIPKSRGCSACGIPQYYCPCVELKEVPVTHLHVKKAAEGLVDEINGILNGDPLSAEKCSNLRLAEIKSAYQNLIHPNVTKFLGSKDIHGRIPMFLDHAKDFECNYHLLIRTVPGEALYEASVQLLDGKLHFSQEISRINKYGDQPKCIAEERPYMRKFCFCKVQN